MPVTACNPHNGPATAGVRLAVRVTGIGSLPRQRRAGRIQSVAGARGNSDSIADIERQAIHDLPLKGIPMIRVMRTAGVAFCTGLLAWSPAQAETFDRGQALYENHCRSCHEEQVHTRETRRATSIGDLHRWVASWSYHAALGWSDEEIADVVDYLDRRYYHFTVQP